MRGGARALASLALALGAVGCGSGAVAPVSPLVLWLEAEPIAVAVGAPVTFRFALENRSGDQAFAVRDPAFDAHATSLHLRWTGADGRPQEADLARFHPNAMFARPAPPTPLAPGATRHGEITLPIVHGGAVHVVARYKGHADHPAVPAILESDPVTVTATPGPTGFVGARLETSKGAIEVQLHPDVAPGHAVNFLALAQAGWYQPALFGRVVQGFVIQGGRSGLTPPRDPEWSIPAEFNDAPHDVGALSMARAGHPDTGSTEFFICCARRPDLDARGSFPCTVFGHVVAGLEVVRAIEGARTGPWPPGQGMPGEISRPLERIVIERVSVVVR